MLHTPKYSGEWGKPQMGPWSKCPDPQPCALGPLTLNLMGCAGLSGRQGPTPLQRGRRCQDRRPAPRPGGQSCMQNRRSRSVARRSGMEGDKDWSCIIGVAGWPAPTHYQCTSADNICHQATSACKASLH